MIILLNCTPDVDVGRLRWRRRYSYSGGLSIDLTRLKDCMVYAEQFLSVISRLSIFEEFLAANHARIATILRRSSWFHPRPPDILHAPHEAYNGPYEPCSGTSIDRSRKSCSAAVALSFLRYRKHSRLPDRLAIIANMCDYPVRLDTREIEKSHKSLAVCIFTLAILNADLSLLHPEVYQYPPTPTYGM